MAFFLLLKKVTVDVVQFFKNIFPFSGMKFLGCFIESCCVFLENLVKITYFKYLNCQVNDYFMPFYHFHTTLSYFGLLIYTCRYQSCFRKNQCWVSAVHCWKTDFENYESQCWTEMLQRWFSLKRRWNFQFWTALIQKQTELISSETALNNADRFKNLLIKAEHRWKTSNLWDTALFSGECIWDFNPGDHQDVVLTVQLITPIT